MEMVISTEEVGNTAETRIPRTVMVELALAQMDTVVEAMVEMGTVRQDMAEAVNLQRPKLQRLWSQSPRRYELKSPRLKPKRIGSGSRIPNTYKPPRPRPRPTEFRSP